MILDLSLNINDVNVILAALGKLPHDDVRQVIDKIVNQAKAQSEAKPPVEEQPKNSELETVEDA